MSRIDFASYIEDPTYTIGNSSVIHEQIKACLIAEADENNTFRNFVLAQSQNQQTISGNLFVDGEFATSSAFSTAGFDVNSDGIVDFNAEVHFQPETILQEFVKDGYCDLANDQTINGIKYFTNIKNDNLPTETNDLTNKYYVDNGILTLQDNVQNNLDLIDTEITNLENSKQPNIQTTDNIEINDLILNNNLIIGDSKISKSKIIDLNNNLTDINNSLTNLENTKQPNLTNNSINDNWLSNNIPRYNIANVFDYGIVCDELTVINDVNISDGSLNKSKILDLNTDLTNIQNSLTSLENNKQNNLTNNSINDMWLSVNIPKLNQNTIFENDLTVQGVLYAENMTVTNLTTINQTSTEESITNLTVNDITIDNNLVMGQASTLSLLDNSISISKVNNLTNILNSKASTTALTNGLSQKQNNIQDNDLQISYISGLSTQLNDRVTYDVYTSGLGTKQNVINDNDLSIGHINTLQTVLDSKSSTTQLTDGLALKQNVINDGDLSISKVLNLQTSLDSKSSTTQLTNGLALKQNVINDGDLSISKVLNLQSSLDSKSSTTQLTDGLALKQDVINDDDLSISKVLNLQSSLDSKSSTTQLTDGLALKQDLINDDDLSISKVLNLQSSLDSKASTTQLNDGLDLKQDLINDGDLSISKVLNLQSSLDSKASTTDLNDGLALKQDVITAGSITDNLLSSTFLKPDTNLIISSGRTLTISGSIIAGGTTISPSEISYLDNLTEPLPTTLTSLQSQIDNISSNIDLSNYQTLISDTNQIQKSNVSGLSTSLTNLQSQIDNISSNVDLSGYQTLISDTNQIQKSNVSGLSTSLTNLQSQIDGLSTPDLSNYQTLISDTNKIEISNVNNLSTTLATKQDTITNGSIPDSALSSTFVKPNTAPTLTGSNFTGIPTSAIINYAATTVETISGTASLAPDVNVSIVTGSSHSLALSSIVGLTKTIVNNNDNCFSPILTTQAGAVNPQVSIMLYDASLNRMYLGGNFTNLNGVTGANSICYYDFTTSSIIAMGTGATGGNVLDIKKDGTKIFITGVFASVNSIANTQRIAYWDTSNSTWYAMGNGLQDNNGQKMLVYNGNLYVVGSFNGIVGTANTVRIARWNIASGTWNALGLGVTAGGLITDIILIGTKIWICGQFTAVNGTSPVSNSSRLAYWETTNSTWYGYGANQYNGNIQSIRDMGNNKIFVGGAYTTYGSPAVYAPYTTLYDTSTGSITQYGKGQSPGGTFVDADGVFWIVSLFTSLGSNIVGDNNSFYPTSGALAWFNTTTNQWVPVVTNGVFNCISDTGTAGEYWLGGQINTIDNNAVTGLSGLVRFNKNNVTTITTTNLVNNGLTNRTNFKMYYKGQSVMLINPDNSTWMVSNNTYLGANAPSVLLY